MKVSQAIAYTKATTLQNISSDWASDDQWLFILNQALIFIYCNITATKGSWYRSNMEESISPDVNTTLIYTAKYGIGKIWEVQDSTGNIIYEAPVSPKMITSRAGSDEDEKGFKRVNSSSKQIETVNDLGGIYIIYSRMPKMHAYADITKDDLDLPDELMCALQVVINWLITPIHLEQGFSLSNAYLQQAKMLIDEYCQATNTYTQGFTA